MKSMALIRLFVIGFLAAILLSIVSLISLKKVIELGSAEHRRFFVMSIANRLEERPLDENSLKFFVPKGRPLFMPGGLGGPYPSHLGGPRGPGDFGPIPPMHPPPPPGGGRFRLNLWLVAEDGQVISANSDKKLPESWRRVKVPKEAHDLTTNESIFRLASTTMIVKLDSKPPAYLIAIQDDEGLMSGPAFASQAALTFITVCLAIFFSLFFTFMYLRRKSLDAKSVLLRLERGDLKARFEIKRMDEFGNLMLDFNRMANEIERLVHRIHETEKSRKNLLQELGHDLRTPLTGLTTAFETLKYHFPKINESDREELFKIMGSEITYLRDLLEKLLTIATLDEPHYKTSTESIDLEDLVAQEIQSRQSAANSPASVKWSFKTHVSQEDPGTLLGDPHLIMRLLRNGLDNAAKYARHQVEVSLNETSEDFEILIKDDGPGISAQGIETFGKRRDYSARAMSGLQYSLGLGSVIMKTVAELHGGSVEIENRADKEATAGSSLRIRLPKVL
jgi:signal transduction histidine kinase